MDHQQTNDNEPEHWKQFQGTQLGGLLSGIYGSNRPVINYPKPKKSSNSFIPGAVKFNSGGGKVGSTDPRKSTRRSTDNLIVPKVNGRSGRNENVYHPIDLLDRRKGADAIKLECDKEVDRQRHYRPGNFKSTSSDAEKDRLSQIFTFHGGKILPSDVSAPKTLAPFEIAQQKKEFDGRNNVRLSRGLKPKNSNKMNINTKSLSTSETMADQISSEIQERSDYLGIIIIIIILSIYLNIIMFL
jgi:hypothetical protein